jgi:NADPH-dependent 2,4-dienoyl-CoA reductase/sulfur reductase-like enzyme
MRHADVLVIGAGPAGIAAATAAAEHGREVLVLDDNAASGGQIWRDDLRNAHAMLPPMDRRKRLALARLKRSGAQVLSGYRVFDADRSGSVHAVREDSRAPSATRFTWNSLVLATGARERFLPFPGWTSPGVLGAGGLQALAQGGLPVEGKDIVLAGTGPLLLAVAAHLRKRGARIPLIAEQVPALRLARFAASLCRYPGKLMQGLIFRGELLGTRFRTGCWPVAALANADGNALRAIALSDGVRIWEQPCDLLACGFHLVPNTEIAALLGCTLRGSFVVVDTQQHTSVRNIFCAGEPTGIAGLKSALLQGEIAGLACAGQPTQHLERRLASERRFAERLQQTFWLRPELHAMPTPQTIICRCEDVPLGSLAGCESWRQAKLLTRCGMGPCQGRVCGPIVHTLFGWEPASVRQPIFPVPLDALCLDPDSAALEEESQRLRADPRGSADSLPGNCF